MKITSEQKDELLNEWNKIGENDCLPPSSELEQLFIEILDHLLISE